MLLTLMAALSWGATGSGGSPPPAGGTQDGTLKEYEFKAQYIAWFAKLSTWPRKKLPEDPATPMRIAVLGKRMPFSSKSAKLLRSLTHAGKRKTELVLAADAEAAKKAHLLFIPKTIGDATARAVYRALAGHDVLIIDGKRRSGAHVQFHQVAKTIRFWIDTGQVKKTGIRLDSRLLRTSRKPEKRR